MPAVAMARCNVNGKGAARCYETSPRTQVRATDLHEDVVREVFMTCLMILMIGVVACPRPHGNTSEKRKAYSCEWHAAEFSLSRVAKPPT